MREHALQSPTNETQWRAYHSIRRKVLFENRGHFDVYDEHHPDEVAPGNHPMILLHRGEPIGTIRIDIGSKEAIFRRVAIREDCQRSGHGRALLSLAEEFAREKGCETVRSFVNPEAVGFYEQCGFRVDRSAPSDPQHFRMAKKLG